MNKRKCKDCSNRIMGLCKSDTKCPYLKKKTLFNVLSSSKKKLAEKLIYAIFIDDNWGSYYRSTLVDDSEWKIKEKAIKATIDKLNEVQDE